MEVFESILGCEPLFRKGDKFVILKRNNDSDLMPIEARRLKDGKIYGFETDELKLVN